MRRGWILSLGWLIWAGCIALLLPARLRAVESGLHDAVRQHLTETGFDDVDVAMDGQSVELRWHGDPAKATDEPSLRADLVRAAETAAAARPNDWPFPHLNTWSDWATAPVIVAVADPSSVPNLPPPPPIVATESDPAAAMALASSVLSASSSSAATSPLAAAVVAAAATPAAAAPVAVAPVAVNMSASESAAATCTDKVTAAISGRRLHFVSSSAQLTSGNDAVLDDVYKVIRGCRDGLRLEVDGYTDNVGPAPANLTLSFERARAAAAALVKRGLPQDMVDAHGFGPQNPVASNASDTGRAANRRVVFILRPA